MLSVPAEVDTGHLIEDMIVRSIELPQTLYHVPVDGRMTSTLAAAEAARLPAAAAGAGAAGRRSDAREAGLGGVEVEVSIGDERTQAEEALDGRHLGGRMGDEALAADEVDPAAPGGSEPVEPRPDVDRVETEPDRAPAGVHRRRRRVGTVHRGQRQAGEVARLPRSSALGRRLGEVRQRPRHRVADHDQQPEVTWLAIARHVVDPLGDAARHEVAGRLLDGQLRR